jgi:hypothetical protein
LGQNPRSLGVRWKAQGSIARWSLALSPPVADRTIFMRGARMSDWVYGIVAMVGVTTLALAIQGLILRRVPLSTLEAHHEVAGALIVVLGAMYGILVATVLVAVWDRYDEAQTDTVREANHVATLYRSVESLTAPEGERLRGLSLDYLDSVVREEWPLLRKGEAGPKTGAIVEEMWRTAASWNPPSRGETNLHAEALRSVIELAELRRKRIARSHTESMPGVWIIMVVGGIFVIGFSFFFGLAQRFSKQLMTASLTLMIVLLLFATRELQRPFAGIAAIRPDDYEIVLRMLSPDRAGKRLGAGD